MIRFAFVFLTAFLGVLPHADAQTTPPTAASPREYAGLREEVRRADAVMRIEIHAVKFKNAPDDWKSTDAPTPEMSAECTGVVRTVYKGVIAKPGEEIKLSIPLLALQSYYSGPLTKAGRLFYDGSPPAIGDDRVFFVQAAQNRFEVTNTARVFFDWVIDSDSLFRRFAELSWTDASETAIALVKLLVRILISDPARGDPYGVRAVILDDWQRYRRSLTPNDATEKLVRLVVPDMVTTARYAAEGAPLTIVIALAPLLSEDDRREIVGALLRLNRSFTDPSPVDETVAKRRRNLQASLPVMLELVMHPARDAAVGADSAQTLAEAEQFAGPAADHPDPAWNEWVAQLAEKFRRADKTREEQADVTTLESRASDIVVGVRSTEKVGTDYHLVLLKVTQWVKNSAGSSPSQFVYIRITPESKKLIGRLKSPGGAAIPVRAFLRVVPEAVTKTWAFRGQQLSTIDPRRFELADADNGIIAE